MPCSVLDERIQQLDERVNNIQNRLRESMHELNRQSRFTRYDDIRSATRHSLLTLCSPSFASILQLMMI